MDDRRAFLLGNFERNDFILEAAVFVRFQCLLMTTQSDLILVLAADLIFLRDVFRCLAIINQRIQFAHAAVGKTPAQRAIVHRHVSALEGICRLRHHPGAASHTLDAPGDEKIAVFGLDSPSRLIDCFENGAA